MNGHTAILSHIHRIENNTEIPSWRCEATFRKTGKRHPFWMRGSQIVTEEQCRELAARSFPWLDCDPRTFRCERRLGERPPYNKEAVPVDWFRWGTDRMRAEIDAGLRPHSDYLLPPIELVNRRAQSILRGRGARPAAQRLPSILRG